MLNIPYNDIIQLFMFIQCVIFKRNVKESFLKSSTYFQLSIKENSYQHDMSCHRHDLTAVKTCLYMDDDVYKHIRIILMNI